MYNSQLESNQVLHKLKLVKQRINLIQSLNLEEKIHNEIITHLQKCMNVLETQLQKEAI